jgi:hypothetical protein
MDFTVNKYKFLLRTLIDAGYHFQTFTEFLENPDKKVILLRHDVDAKKQNSLHFAQIQNEMGVKGSYYFRMVPQSFDEKVIREIADLGHEIGYHYEDMDFAVQRIKSPALPAGRQEPRIKTKDIQESELYDDAFEIFKDNLEKIRKLYPVKTICMHGSPRSAFDNKALWKKYDYKKLGIIGEPYFDINFDEVFYLTDTGRRWNGEKVSVRDKVQGSGFGVRGSGIKKEVDQSKAHKLQLSFHSTDQIIKAATNNKLPDQIMFTFHPQRWTNNPTAWLWELFFQNLKNQVKKYVINQKIKNTSSG